MQQIVESAMTTKKGSRMGGLGRLSDFGKTSQPELALSPELSSQPEQVINLPVVKQQAVQDKPVAINIKITRDQQSWLGETAQIVRDNNDTPVAPGDRVFPQHLIGTAIDLLQKSDIDWSQVKNMEEVRQLLRL